LQENHQMQLVERVTLLPTNQNLMLRKKIKKGIKKET
jgi:hypothetical protein